MSMSSPDKDWGPSHQYLPPPGHHRGHWKLGVIALIVIAVELLSYRASHPDGHNAFTWTTRTLALGGLVLVVVFLIARAIGRGQLRFAVPRERSPVTRIAERIERSPNPSEAV